MHRGLQIIMAMLMIMAIYCTFRYRVIPSAADIDTKKVVVIDPGHGGDDPGKVSNDGYLEKNINLQISQKLKSSLEKQNFRVIMTRENDDGLYKQTDSNKKIADMKARCRIIEESGALVVVSIHQNSFSRENAKGAQVFYYKYSAEGEKLAYSIQDAIKQGADPENNRVIKDNSSYYMLVHTPCPTVIVECGFLSNTEEAGLLISEGYQQKMADSICNGIVEYFKEAEK